MGSALGVLAELRLPKRTLQSELECFELPKREVQPELQQLQQLSRLPVGRALAKLFVDHMDKLAKFQTLAALKKGSRNKNSLFVILGLMFERTSVEENMEVAS